MDSMRVAQFNWRRLGLNFVSGFAVPGLLSLGVCLADEPVPAPLPANQVPAVAATGALDLAACRQIAFEKQPRLPPLAAVLQSPTLGPKHSSTSVLPPSSSATCPSGEAGQGWHRRRGGNVKSGGMGRAARRHLYLFNGSVRQGAIGRSGSRHCRSQATTRTHRRNHQ